MIAHKSGDHRRRTAETTDVTTGRPAGCKVANAPFPSPRSVPRPASRGHLTLSESPDPHKQRTKDERIRFPQLARSRWSANLTAVRVLKQLDDGHKVRNLRVAVNGVKDEPMFIDAATFGA
jgi:hypothetical protein